jgi:hypothetical protein
VNVDLWLDHASVQVPDLAAAIEHWTGGSACGRP